MMSSRDHSKKSSSSSSKRGFSAFQVVILVMCALMAERVFTQPSFASMSMSIANAGNGGSDLAIMAADADADGDHHHHHHPPRRSALAVPVGGTENLPSVRVEVKDVDDARKIYGGKGDKAHLGGFTDIDMHGISPAVWKHVVSNWTVQSVMDIGCGRGISTSWFYTHGLRTECVEGSHDAIENTMVPDPSILTEHDFSRGPWWPSSTFDMVWAVEFLEHVNLQFHYNYVSTFRKAAILLVTSSRWGGWHHVEVHPDEWWIRKYEMYGFKHDEALTMQLRKIALNEKNSGTFPPNGEQLNAQHVWGSLKVFINPEVAALPEHAHLFGEFGCFYDYKKGWIYNRECGVVGEKYKKNKRHIAQVSRETRLDPDFYPVKLDPSMDEAWYEIVKANIQQQQQQPDGEEEEEKEKK